MFGRAQKLFPSFPASDLSGCAHLFPPQHVSGEEIRYLQSLVQENANLSFSNYNQNLALFNPSRKNRRWYGRYLHTRTEGQWSLVSGQKDRRVIWRRGIWGDRHQKYHMWNFSPWHSTRSKRQRTSNCGGVGWCLVAGQTLAKAISPPLSSPSQPPTCPPTQHTGWQWTTWW